MRDLAVLLSDKDDFDGSVALNREALMLARQRLGNEHADVAGILTNLAMTLKRGGDLAEAEALYREALSIRRKALGDEHPDVAHTLNNLAVLLRDRGAYAEAESFYREAIAIQERAFPPGHQVIGISRAGLGRTLQQAAAEPLQSPDVRDLRLSEAEALLRAADEAYSALPNVPLLFRQRCLEWLIELYDFRHTFEPEKGYDAKAASYRSRLEKLTTPP